MSIQTRSTALQNEIVRLYCTFEIDGRLSNPASQPLIEIIDTDGATVLDTLPAQCENVGVWYADWYVPKNLPLGQYYDRWTFQWSTMASIKEQTMTFTVYSFENYINAIRPAITEQISNRALQLMADLSNDIIYEAQHIPIYWEQAMRVQQENQAKRTKQYFYFTLDQDIYSVASDAVYFNNGQKFTVWQSITPEAESSESSSYSSANTSESTESSSSSTGDSNSSSSSSSISSESSLSSDSTNSVSSSSIDSSSSSSAPEPTTTTTTTPYVFQPTLTCVGTGTPSTSGVLTKISGIGPSTINYTSFTSKTSRFSTIYELAYNNWNQDPRPKVRLNNRIVDDGWIVDWNGRIFFDGMMAPEDSVNVTYNFAYFKNEEILSFLNMGLQMMNSTPPSSIYYPTLMNMPGEWNAPVVLYAAVLALKRLIFGLNFQEKRVIFGTPEEARAAIQTFQSLYQDYNTTWLEIKKNAKTQKLYGMSQIITPEFTLPGGRSRWMRYMFKSN